jgi:hypothetical protein
MGASAKLEQKERLAVLKNDQQSNLRPDEHEPTTLHAMSKLSNDLEGRASARDYVAGSDAATDYPTIPSGPWSSGYGRLPDEPSLGYAINDLVPCGEPHEIAASLGREDVAPASMTSPPTDAVMARVAETASLPIPPQVRRRRI